MHGACVVYFAYVCYMFLSFVLFLYIIICFASLCSSSPSPAQLALANASEGGLPVVVLCQVREPTGCFVNNAMLRIMTILTIIWTKIIKLIWMRARAAGRWWRCARRASRQAYACGCKAPSLPIEGGRRAAFLWWRRVREQAGSRVRIAQGCRPAPRENGGAAPGARARGAVRRRGDAAPALRS